MAYKTSPNTHLGPGRNTSPRCAVEARPLSSFTTPYPAPEIKQPSMLCRKQGGYALVPNSSLEAFLQKQARLVATEQLKPVEQTTPTLSSRSRRPPLMTIRRPTCRSSRPLKTRMIRPSNRCCLSASCRCVPRRSCRAGDRSGLRPISSDIACCTKAQPLGGNDGWQRRECPPSM